MRKLAAATLALGLALPATGHEDTVPDIADPVSLRMVSMKQVGAGMKALGDMAKGEAAFSVPLAAMSLRAMLAAASGYGELFPEGTGIEDDHHTTAAPAVWEDRAGFEAELAEFVAKLHARVEQPPMAQAELGAVMGEIGASCRSCHESYRVKRN